jgi:multiple antibiotic resistance protein
MIAGGILLFIVATEILTRGEWTFGNPRTITNLERESPNMVNDLLPNTDNESGGKSGVVPLAFPLLARPGAITSVLISYQSNGLLISILSIAIVVGLTFLILGIADSINRLLGQRGSMIVTRVFAVIVAAIAVQYIIQVTGKTIVDMRLNM